jgi:hypothetical protein
MRHFVVEHSPVLNAPGKRPLVSRIGLFIVLSLLAACATPASPPATGTGANVAVPSDAAWPIMGDGVGRSGPDGGPLVADRGIGGTGAPASATMQRTAERGIGGTGIVGVVTGFGSIFVNGMEIRYDDSAPVDIDGTVSSATALRAGQLVAIRADGPAAAPYATKISVRSAVTGRIEALELGSGMLTIGGQAVSVPAGTWGASHFGLGDWVRVSGLPRADGSIVASRLDAAAAGVLSARGRVVRDGGVVRVGNLVLPQPMAASVTDGQFVIVSGDYAAGHGRVAAVAPDALFPNPADYFGASASRLIVQAYVRVDKGALSINGKNVIAGSAVSGLASHDGMAIVSLERGRDRSFTAVGLRYAGYHGSANRPIRPGTGTGDGSQTSERNGHSNAATPAQPDAGDNAPAASDRLATTSGAGGPDAMNGPPASAMSSEETTPMLMPNPLVPDPIVVPAAPDRSSPPVTPDTPSVTGTPALESMYPPEPVISSNSHYRSGIAWASDKTYGAADWHAHERPGAGRVWGSTSGSTIDLLTTAVTSVSTAGDRPESSKGRAATGSTALVTVAVSKSSKTIGTTAGRSFAGIGHHAH